MKKLFILMLPVIAIIGLVLFNGWKHADPVKKGYAVSDGLTLPEGFAAVTVADNLGGARHLVVTPENDIYVHLAGTKSGKGILVLHESGDKAVLKTSFASFGGTGIAIKKRLLVCFEQYRCFSF